MVSNTLEKNNLKFILTYNPHLYFLIFICIIHDVKYIYISQKFLYCPNDAKNCFI